MFPPPCLWYIFAVKRLQMAPNRALCFIPFLNHHPRWKKCPVTQFIKITTECVSHDLSAEIIADSANARDGWIVIVTSSDPRVEKNCVVLVTALPDRRS